MTRRIFTGEFLEEDIADDDIPNYIRALIRYSEANGVDKYDNVSILGKHLGALIRIGQLGGWNTMLEDDDLREEDRAMELADFKRIMAEFDEVNRNRPLNELEIENYGKVAYDVFEVQARSQYPDRAKVPWDAVDEKIQHIFKKIAAELRQTFMEDGK